MGKAEEAVELAQRAYEAEPHDLSDLTNSIQLFSQAGGLSKEQKGILERVVENATRAYIPLMLRDPTSTRDPTFTERAILAYRTLLREGNFDYGEVGPDSQADLDKILTLSVLYFRRAEQLKEQAGELRKRGAEKDADALIERKNKLYQLGNLEAQIYFGKQIGRIQEFSDVEAAITRLDHKDRLPGFREILLTGYVMKGLREAYTLQNLGQYK
ncbi:hypothetical protein HYT54_03315 [Candidatus Woesearchaeota archaeon]|nr:hypothetical protein [Candidatus Woesearchaeota archaeon]